MYTIDLFTRLDKLGTGARIRGIFMGLFGYADDLALLCNTVEGLQRMLDETAEYASDLNVNFSTNVVVEKSKTKSMVFGGGKTDELLKPIILNGKPLPWVRRVKYLGTTITNEFNILEEDIASKKAKFFDNSNSLLQEFKSAHPYVKAQINSIYNGSVYGSNLYNMESVMFKQLINSFNTATQAIWDIPHETHKYLVGELSAGHMLTNIIANKIGFYQRLRHSHKLTVRLLYQIAARDLRTTTGSSLRYIRNVGIDLGLLNYESDILGIDVKRFKSMHRHVNIPDEENYRVGVLTDLLDLRTQFSYFEDDQFAREEIEAMIRDVCVT